MQKDRMQSCAEGLANPGGFSTLLTSRRPRASRRAAHILTFSLFFFGFLRRATDRRTFRKIRKFPEIDDGLPGPSRTPRARFLGPEKWGPEAVFRYFFGLRRESQKSLILLAGAVLREGPGV